MASSNQAKDQTKNYANSYSEFCFSDDDQELLTITESKELKELVKCFKMPIVCSNVHSNENNYYEPSNFVESSSQSKLVDNTDLSNYNLDNNYSDLIATNNFNPISYNGSQPFTSTFNQ